jgi:hypothetical protein
MRSAKSSKRNTRTDATAPRKHGASREVCNLAPRSPRLRSVGSRQRVILASFSALLMAACSSSAVRADGQVRHVCGQIINEPASGMQRNVSWYHDLSHSGTHTTFRLPATPHLDYRASPWIQVSHNCATGARMTIEPAGHIKVVDRVYSRSHRYTALRLYGYAPGHVVLAVNSGTKIVSSTTITVAAP